MNEGVIGERPRQRSPAFKHRWRNYRWQRGINFNGFLLAVTAIAIACLLLCLFTPLNRLFELAFLVQILQEWGSWAVLLFVLTYIVATAIGVPGTAMTIAGGAVFGLGWGSFWSVVGATLGALAAFWIARYLCRDWAMRKFGQYKMLMRFNQAVVKEPLRFVLAVRFVPISPFNLVNFLFGLTPINWVDYTAGTFFGIIPGTLAYTWLGVTGERALEGGDRLPFFLALAFLAVLSMLPVITRRCQYK